MSCETAVFGMGSQRGIQKYACITHISMPVIEFIYLTQFIAKYIICLQ